MDWSAAPNHPTLPPRSVGRRLLIDRVKLEPGKTPGGPNTVDAGGREVLDALGKLASSDHKAYVRARAVWTFHGITAAAGVDDSLAEALLKDDDPRLREMAVRILGRDCRENGKVAYTKPEAKQLPAALAHLEILAPMAGDPDAGVRRADLGLANLPTDKAGEALKRLAAAWDGEDRWYLEALGLALEGARVRSCRRSSTARSTAILPSTKRATTVTLPFRRISRSIGTKRSLQRARPTGGFPQSASLSAWPGGCIGRKFCPSSSASCPHLRDPTPRDRRRRSGAHG